MRGLRDAGFSYGVYSYLSGWQSITGSWRLPGVPVWATAGRLDYPGEAQDRCRQASFSGGRVQMAQWYDDTRDYDLTCDPYTFTAAAGAGVHAVRRDGRLQRGLEERRARPGGGHGRPAAVRRDRARHAVRRRPGRHRLAGHERPRDTG